VGVGEDGYYKDEFGEVMRIDDIPPLGHGEQRHCPLPKPMESLRGIKVDAVIASHHHTLALANDGSVYVWATEVQHKGVRSARAPQ
jgi:alpha-tubulin suppressor-like RCC1 family protein